MPLEVLEAFRYLKLYHYEENRIYCVGSGPALSAGELWYTVPVSLIGRVIVLTGVNMQFGVVCKCLSLLACAVRRDSFKRKSVAVMQFCIRYPQRNLNFLSELQIDQ